MVERPLDPAHVGGTIGSVASDAPIMAVVRGDRLLRFDDSDVAALQAGDRLVCLCSNAA